MNLCIYQVGSLTSYPFTLVDEDCVRFLAVRKKSSKIGKKTTFFRVSVFCENRLKQSSGTYYIGSYHQAWDFWEEERTGRPRIAWAIDDSMMKVRFFGWLAIFK